MPEPWSEARVQQLRDLLAEGKSTVFIAWSMGVTKNAIIGKCGRLGINISELRGRKRDMTPRKLKVPNTIERLVPVEGTGRTRFTLEAIPVKPEPKPVPVVPKSFNKKLAELDNNSCRWPLWGHDTPLEQQFYCGAVCGDKTYCEQHCEVAYYRLKREPIPFLTRRRRPANSPKSMAR